MCFFSRIKSGTWKKRDVRRKRLEKSNENLITCVKGARLAVRTEKPAAFVINLVSYSYKLRYKRALRDLHPKDLVIGFIIPAAALQSISYMRHYTN